MWLHFGNLRDFHCIVTEGTKKIIDKGKDRNIKDKKNVNCLTRISFFTANPRLEDSWAHTNDGCGNISNLGQASILDLIEKNLSNAMSHSKHQSLHKQYNIHRIKYLSKKKNSLWVSKNSKRFAGWFIGDFVDVVSLFFEFLQFLVKNTIICHRQSLFLSNFSLATRRALF